MRYLHGLYYYSVLNFINFFLKGTHFFYLKRFLLNSIGIQVGKNSKIVAPILIGSAAKLVIGDNCWINRDFSVEGNGKVIINNNCDIAVNVSILTGSHQISNRERRAGKGIQWDYVIDSGCWIGARATILNGANIEQGVVIGAGSLVNKNCNANCLYAGIPARKIKEFED